MDRTRDFLRGRRRSELTAEEMAVLEAAISEVVVVPPRRIIAHRADRLHNSTLLIEGFICRYMDARDGYRQLVSYQVPGDFVDLHGYPTRHIDHDIATLTESRIALVPHERLDAIMATMPHLARLLWFSTLLDAALHREWIFRIGRLDAAGRVAHFLCETNLRMAAVGRAVDGRFALPLLVAVAATALYIWFFRRQVRLVAQARFPTLRAVEALILVAAMFLALFSMIYVMVSLSDPPAFTEPLDPFTGYYFSLTVLATVGFGDITPVTTLARSITMVQMALDLAFIAVVIRVFTTSARRALIARGEATGTLTDSEV